jgi:hypothetical protein
MIEKINYIILQAAIVHPLCSDKMTKVEHNSKCSTEMSIKLLLKSYFFDIKAKL